MKLLLSAIAAGLLLGGCASTDTDKAAATKTTGQQETVVQTRKAAKADDHDNVLCTREVISGSHRKVRVCRTVAERERERDDAQRTLRHIQQGGTKPVN